MHPILFTIGEFEVWSYPVFYSIAVIAMFWVAVVRAPRFHVKHDTILNSGIVAGVGMLFGSQAWYVILHRRQFAEHWLAALNPFSFDRAGTASAGGVILAVLAVWLYARFAQQRFLSIVDAVVPGFLLAVAIARTGGCFLAGCCFGKPTDSVLGVVFPPEGHLSPFPLGTPLWPTQVFYGLLGLVGFFLVLRLERRFRFHGATFALVAAYYAVGRFLVEQFRYYPASQVLGTLGPLTITANHPLLGGLLVLSAVVWLRGRHSSRPPGQPSGGNPDNCCSGVDQDGSSGPVCL
jgi:phosphatidylglycerol:prolipoprotein diacylglycerol transferase